MKKVIIALLLILPCFADAQQKIVYQTDFSKDDGFWSYSNWDDQTYYRKVENGKFVFEQRDSKFVYTTYSNFFIDKIKPFQIDFDVTMTEGEAPTGVSLQLYAQNGNYYFFEIKPSGGGIWVGTYTKDKKWESFNAYESNDYLTKSSAVKGLNEKNHCTIEFGTNRVKFSVNGETLFDESVSVFRDFYNFENIGIRSGGICKFTIDNFVFKQDQEEINLLNDASAQYSRVLLDQSINSVGADRQPIISADGKNLYFIRMWYEGNTGHPDYDDIYVSKVTNDTIYTKAENIGSPLNNSGHNSIIAVSSDNHQMYILNTYNADGSTKGGGFSMTQKTADGWSIPKDVLIDDFYNTGGSIEACLSSDRKVFIFAIKRNDSFGLNDMYISFLKADGSYSAPKNMGLQVNSWGWETCPFLAADDKTLYFSTNGRPGFGYGDIFMTKRLDDTWMNWSEPLNLGKSVNTSGAEGFFVIPASGNCAYMASTEAGTYDIYRLEIPSKAKPEPVVIFSGRVLNGKTKEFIGTQIEIKDLVTNELLAEATSSPQDGSYSVLLKQGRKLAFAAAKEGFYPVSENIDLTTLGNYQEYSKDLLLFPIEKGQTVKLNNVFFDFDKATLKDESFSELNDLIVLLNKNAKIKIELLGHTDDKGSDEYNYQLALDRVNSVKSYLVNKGVSSDRITVVSHGESRPIDVNTTEVGRSANRRVEFKILDM